MSPPSLSFPSCTRFSLLPIHSSDIPCFPPWPTNFPILLPPPPPPLTGHLDSKQQQQQQKQKQKQLKQLQLKRLKQQ
ncbi:hypothetical protein CLOM_g23201 [Closterium sp. NIES-68]|nr:hypothetical protein CLOM_g23201 [Closterium sp. NIES-68]